jgi:hypothetical protein
MTLLDADIKADELLGEDTCELFEAIECSFGINLGDYRSHCGRTIRNLAAEIETLAKYPSAVDGGYRTAAQSITRIIVAVRARVSSVIKI